MRLIFSARQMIVTDSLPGPEEASEKFLLQCARSDFHRNRLFASKRRKSGGPSKLGANKAAALHIGEDA